MKRHVIKVGAALMALGLLASACGESEESVEAGSSPLAEFLGQDFDFDSDEAQVQFQNEERERQEKIAACMKAEGFDYIPVDMSDFDFFGFEDGLDYDSREFAEKYGFGISTQRFSQEEVGPDLVGHTYDEQFDTEDGPTDPNQEIVEAMDDSTRDAYYEALYGAEDDFPVFDETMSEEVMDAAMEDFDFQPSGCEGEAYAEDPTNAFYQEFDNELQELYEAVENDPRLAEAQAELGECVNEKGFDVGTSGAAFDDIFETFNTELSEIDQLIGGFPGDDLSEDDFATMTDEELEAIFNQPRELTDEARAKLAEIQERETDLAVAMFDCGGGPFGGAEEIYSEVQAEYEEKFLQDNAERLEQYKADA